MDTVKEVGREPPDQKGNSQQDKVGLRGGCSLKCILHLLPAQSLPLLAVPQPQMD